MSKEPLVNIKDAFKKAKSKKQKNDFLNNIIKKKNY